MEEIEDPLKLYESAQAGAKASLRRYERVTREVFTTVRGREWLSLAMAKHNYMGSVFATEDGMNPTAAAKRDGIRELLSDILNSACAGRARKPGTSNTNTNDEEEVTHNDE